MSVCESDTQGRLFLAQPHVTRYVLLDRRSVDGLYWDGTGLISRERRIKRFVIRRETANRASKPRTSNLSLAIGMPYGAIRTFVSPHEESLIRESILLPFL